MTKSRKPLIIDIITIFPQLFESYLSEALISRAQKKAIVRIRIHNLRTWTTDNHQTVDGRPYGGGAGMVLLAEPIIKAIKAVKQKGARSVVVAFSAKGKKFTQAKARNWSRVDQLIFICGRYEGIDERINKYVVNEEISIGDYVLFGGEVPALVVTEAVTRLLPGAVGKPASIQDESFRPLSKIEKEMMDQFVEYPHYTRPEKLTIAGTVRSVPKVLLSGNHKSIEEWRHKASLKNTSSRQKPR